MLHEHVHTVTIQQGTDLKYVSLKRQTIILLENFIWKIVVKTCTYTQNNFREISTLITAHEQ